MPEWCRAAPRKPCGRRSISRGARDAGPARPYTRESGTMASNTNGRSNRGFAAMDAVRQREIASKGGRAAHAQGTAHEFSPDEAREAGRKGGQMVSRDREHMSAIGRKGGEARGAARRTGSSHGMSERAMGD